ncbi:uncharacterized protein STEHIDRAFT_64436 [Stereum hirsutum FP-91666 SS1]|uniref:uncharacterized protein n=1 Tax=Stereum hirsutum (strain FP-91666) TaxID=721885 RepID=UPI00044495B5|nr:uncharacterized protein STEHIDRAFT_64436 [Stereum hirsutum FP-91666 SS1]EIM83101.1 hypothetical protein STEHIDRAFT_64436 [Stereum hirsutum FP-91666 SS1]
MDLYNSPASPEVRRPGQRQPVAGTVGSSNSRVLPQASLSSDESTSESVKVGTTRIVRGTRPVAHSRQSSDPNSVSDADRAKFNKFRFTFPEFEEAKVKAAWKIAGGDPTVATNIIRDPSFKLPSTPSPVHAPAPSAAVSTHTPASASKHEHPPSGRVKEFEEATRAQRAAQKERGRSSKIYAHRPLEVKQPSPRKTTPPRVLSKAESPLSPPPPSPPSPEVVRPKRLTKRKVVESDEESEIEISEADSGPSSLPISRKSEGTSDERRVLNYFNSVGADSLQQLTGCTPVQADAIVALRPFEDVEDLKAKLGQGKKKAGPAGISSRMFDECVKIFRGYGTVDNVLEDCEEIGNGLKEIIASWSSSSDKGKGRADSGGSRTPDDSSEGALSLTNLAVVADRQPKDFMTEQPRSLTPGVQLKDYQLIGVNWLRLLYKRRLSCILADEMGLGKTVQVISFFALLKEQGNKGPHLIVVPSSTLENWVREFDRFAPSISVRTYYGTKDERPMLRHTLNDTQRRQNKDGWEVLITTYNLASGDEKDRKFFRKMEWDCCVYDEGHVLKNFESQRYHTLMRNESRWRLLLTGTPLQNNLQELVVLKDLPKKRERIEWCDMNVAQQTIYDDALQRSRKIVFDTTATGTETPPNTRGKAAKKAKPKAKDKKWAENSSNVLMDLRKAASHPMLFRHRFTDKTLDAVVKLLVKETEFKTSVPAYLKEDMEVMSDAELQAFFNQYRYMLEADCYLQAGKIDVLLRLLNQYRSEDRRILIFSQFVQVLDILQVIFKQQNIEFLLLTGATPVDARQSLVDEFNENESIPVFLLSTKAGGMGLNLTSASVVVLFDQDFNPHNDKQAQDRAYRIGQKRDVDIIKLITRGTIEEDMLRLGQTKLALDEAVAGELEGEAGDKKAEEKVAKTLMSVLRNKLEHSEVDGDIEMKDGTQDS